jgi:hypothetical protein
MEEKKNTYNTVVIMPSKNSEGEVSRLCTLIIEISKKYKTTF